MAPRLLFLLSIRQRNPISLLHYITKSNRSQECIPMAYILSFWTCFRSLAFGVPRMLRGKTVKNPAAIPPSFYDFNHCANWQRIQTTALLRPRKQTRRALPRNPHLPEETSDRGGRYFIRNSPFPFYPIRRRLYYESILHNDPEERKKKKKKEPSSFFEPPARHRWLNLTNVMDIFAKASLTAISFYIISFFSLTYHKPVPRVPPEMALIPPPLCPCMQGPPLSAAAARP